MTQSGAGSLWDGVLSAIQSTGGARPDEPFSEQLQRVVSRHIAAEETSIGRYQNLLKDSQDAVVRMLLTELITDEEHHHGMLKRMESQLGAELGGNTPGPFSGGSTDMEPAARQAAIIELKDLGNHESAGVKHLRDLAKQARAAGSDLLGLLLDALASDSEKHQRLLKFIEKRLASA
jgi:rubrerythrin